MLNNEIHPWVDCLADFKSRILPVLLNNGKLIGEKSVEGDENSKLIIKLYTLLHRSFDPVTASLIEEKLKQEGYM